MRSAVSQIFETARCMSSVGILPKAWLADALLSLRLHNVLHARLALMVAIVFFTAGLFYRRQT